MLQVRLAVHLRAQKLFGKVAGVAGKAETIQLPKAQACNLPVHRQSVLHQLTWCPHILDILGRPPGSWEVEKGPCHALLSEGSELWTPEYSGSKLRMRVPNVQ